MIVMGFLLFVFDFLKVNVQVELISCSQLKSAQEMFLIITMNKVCS